MFTTWRILADSHSSVVICFGFWIFSKRLVESAYISKRICCIRMISGYLLLLDAQSLLAKVYCLGILSLRMVKLCQSNQVSGRIRVINTENVFPDFKSLSVIQFCLVKLCLCPV